MLVITIGLISLSCMIVFFICCLFGTIDLFLIISCLINISKIVIFNLIGIVDWFELVMLNMIMVRWWWWCRIDEIFTWLCCDWPIPMMINYKINYGNITLRSKWANLLPNPKMVSLILVMFDAEPFPKVLPYVEDQASPICCSLCCPSPLPLHMSAAQMSHLWGRWEAWLIMCQL